MSKMNFYKKFKQQPTLSKYLSLNESQPQKQALTRLLISAHRLKIETGRLKKLDKSDRTCEIRKEAKNTTQIDDEIQFVFDCSDNERERNEIFSLLEIQSPENLNTQEKIEILQDILENNNHANSLKQFAKFIYQAEQKRSKK